jgi:transcriptional regulator with XRE-family HTH domain
MTTSDLMTQYKERQALSVRAMAEALNERMSQENRPISHATVANWCNGKGTPSLDFVLDLLSVYPITDWRFALGVALLVTLRPELFENDILRIVTQPATA